MEETEEITVFDEMLLEKGLPFPARWFLGLANTLYKRNRTRMCEGEACVAILITFCIAIGFVAGGFVAAGIVLCAAVFR